jgi:hypothetical protein
VNSFNQNIRWKLWSNQNFHLGIFWVFLKQIVLKSDLRKKNPLFMEISGSASEYRVWIMFLAWILCCSPTYISHAAERDISCRDHFCCLSRTKIDFLEIVIQTVKIQNAKEIGHWIYIVGYAQSYFKLYFLNFYFYVLISSDFMPIWTQVNPAHPIFRCNILRKNIYKLNIFRKNVVVNLF